MGESDHHSAGPAVQATLYHDRQQIDDAQQQIADALTESGYDETARYAIRLALEEALSNAFTHGHGGDRSRPVTLTYQITSRRVTIEIADQGPGFDPQAVPDPTEDENIENRTGRGLTLMRAYMSEVEFIEPGNRVRMIYEPPG